MFSQLTSFANKLSLDNLQDDDNDQSAVAAATAPDEGGGVSSLLDGLSQSMSRSSRQPVADTEKITQLQRQVHDLRADLDAKTLALEAASQEVSTLRDELRIERTGSRELALRYRSLVDSAAEEAKRMEKLSATVAQLETRLAEETAACEDLKQQLSGLSTPLAAADDTPKKVVKKVKKKKLAVASPVAGDTAPTSPSAVADDAGVQASNIGSASEELQESMLEIKRKYDSNIEELNSEIINLKQTALAAEREYKLRLDDLLAEKSKSFNSMSSLEQKAMEEKELSKQDIKQLQTKVQQLELAAANAESDFQSKFSALTERNELLQDESSLLCQRLAKKETECEVKDEEYNQVLAQKDAKISEISTKLATLTEKAKDYVKKYSDAKAMIASFDEVKSKLTAQLEEVTLSKESEIVKMRLKMEAHDEVNSSQRSAVHELAEKLAESQRELLRCRASLQDGENMIEVLQRDVSDAEALVQTLRNELSESQARQSNANESHQQEILALDSKRERQVADLSETVSGLKNQNAVLLAEIEALVKEKAIGDNALKSLDEYKKKAQAALKKSSETAGSLNSEIAQLKQRLEISEGESASYLESLETERQRREANELALDDLRQQILIMQEAERKYEDSLAAALQAASAPKRIETKDAAIHEQSNKLELKSVSESTPPLVGANLSAPHAENVSDEPSKSTISSVPGGPDGPDADPSDTEDGGLADVPQSGDGNEVKRLRRTVSGTAIQATLASKSGSSCEIAEGLQLPLQVPDKLLYIGEITQQLESLRSELIVCKMERDELNKELESEKVEKSLLTDKLEDCLAFLERSKKLQNGRDSAVNMEYLKNCVLHYMLSDSVSDRLRLYPVIATILKFTTTEQARLKNCPLHVDDIAASIEIADSAWQNISGTIAGFWGSSSSSTTTSGSETQFAFS